MKRPLLSVAILYVGGILLADLFPLRPTVLLGASLLVVAAALAWQRGRCILLYLVIALAGVSNFRRQTAILSPNDLRLLLGAEPHLAAIRGQLIETPVQREYEQGDQTTWRTLTRMETRAVRLGKGTNWQASSGTIAIATPGKLTNWFSGQDFEVTGLISLPRLAVAEGTFDYRAYLNQQGIYYQLKTESERDWHLLSSPSTPPLADRFRDWARAALARGLPVEDESLRLEWALALGWKTALTEEVSEPFVRAATYHIFAVDGLRMAILFGIFFAMLRAVGVPRWFCGLILLPVIWFYVALTGWPASAIRASIMLTIILIGWVLKRPSDPLNSLLAAALVILVWEPQQLFQAGFQLSFLVVLCLILIIPPVFDVIHQMTAPDPWLPASLHPRYPPWAGVPARYASDLLVTSFAAWIGSVPLVAYYFNILTPISTPANLVAVPLCILVLISNLLSLSLASWFSAAAEIFNQAGWFGMECIRLSSDWFAHWPAAYFYTSAPSLCTTGLYYLLLLSLITGWVFRPELRKWKLAILSTLSGLWLWNYCLHLADTRVTVLPLGGGTAVYCDTFLQGKDLLVDAGPSNSVQFVTKPFLRAQGANQLPGLLLSHGDVHHTSGTEPLLELFKVQHIYANPLKFRSTAYRHLLERLGTRPGLLTTISLGDVVRDWTVLHPAATDRFTKADDGALVLKSALNRTRVLLLSDLGLDGQKALLNRATNLEAEVVIAGLPTVGEPLCDLLIDAVRPQLIIISDAEFPVSERASPKLQHRLGRRNIPVLYTRQTGAVTMQFHRRQWELHAASGLRLTSKTLGRWWVAQRNKNSALADQPPRENDFSDSGSDDDPN